MQDAVHYFDEGADKRLESLGLSRRVIIQALEEGLFAYQGLVGTNYPLTYPGTAQWAETTRSLRDQLGSSGDWVANRDGGLERTVNSEGTTAIIVRSGTAGTGRPHETPQARSEIGSRSAAYVRVNAFRQRSLFESENEIYFGKTVSPIVSLPLVSVKESTRMETWVLLFHRDKLANELRAELSLPVSLDLLGQVDDWCERIYLNGITFGGPEFNIDPNVGPDAPVAPTTEVSIERRA